MSAPDGRTGTPPYMETRRPLSQAGPESQGRRGLKPSSRPLGTPKASLLEPPSTPSTPRGSAFGVVLGELGALGGDSIWIAACAAVRKKKRPALRGNRTPNDWPRGSCASGRFAGCTPAPRPAERCGAY